MADRTLAELRNRVLGRLKVLTAGEVADAADTAFVEATIADVNEKLRDKQICFWEDSGYPPAIFQDLAWYVACHCADEYMEEGEASSFRSKNEERSLAELRRLTASTERTDVPTRADFY